MWYRLISGLLDEQYNNNKHTKLWMRLKLKLVDNLIF